MWQWYEHAEGRKRVGMHVPRWYACAGVHLNSKPATGGVWGKDHVPPAHTRAPSQRAPSFKPADDDEAVHLRAPVSIPRPRCVDGHMTGGSAAVTGEQLRGESREHRRGLGDETNCMCCAPAKSTVRFV
eukprot:CAMPEP_0174699184 /NCGR_PEP_ID=MMETSP1094-20130205/4543_1 /TAXON_ID=156173 /ORGANISM="Chrysochromulina brevifilum, Strain UTEX LB 985" /LENGTH=128 /DNA_ID=CAMNT_0015896465 /DNA_START=363 /DNA_END=750 /DNA_ORIENTATION=-